MSIRQHIKNEVQKPMRNGQHIKLKGIDKMQSLVLAFFLSKACKYDNTTKAILVAN